MRIRAVAAIVGGLLLVACARAGSTPPPEVDVLDATILDVQAAMEGGSLTSSALVRAALARIEAYDQRGPAINAILALNPDALTVAAALDEERRLSGPRGPLHGVPVILKDNLQTVDMPTTAGSVALRGWIPPEDATVVQRLRAAGAVLLAKANMHEFAWSVETVSSLGGQTRNPYALDRNPGGSSGGTSAALAAGFAVIGLGTDTCGSVRVPASHTALVGLRPTLGLVSRAGVIPLSHSHDTVGPMARTVTDVALTLDAIAGPDPFDPRSAASAGMVPPGYATFLNPEALRGARIGVVTNLFDSAPSAARETSRVVEAAVWEMEAAGAVTVRLELPDILVLGRSAYVNREEFKFDLNAYLAAQPTAPVRTLTEILDSGQYHPRIEGILRLSQSVAALDTPAYRAKLGQQDAVRATLLAALDGQRLDALLYPSVRQPAAPVGDEQEGYTNCLLAGTSGFPAISVPAGFTAAGLPVGVELLGRAFSEPRLLALAYAYEQATHHRRPPESTPSLGGTAAPSP